MSAGDTLYTLILLAVWAVIHSLTISDGFKEKVAARVGGNIIYYRLGYNLFSLVSFGLVWLLLPSGGEPLWDASGIVWLWFRLVQAGGVVLFFWAMMYFDLRSFLGLDAVCGCADGNEPSAEAAPCDEVLARSGPFDLCRHPMYLAGILVLGFQPFMTQARFILFLWATAYFYLGSLHEERRLARYFGEPYEAYRKEVSRILPWKWIRRRMMAGRVQQTDEKDQT